MQNRIRPWTSWGLAAAALLALLFFGLGFVRSRSLAAAGAGSHWSGFAWMMLGMAVVSLALLMFAAKRLRRPAPNDGSSV